MFSTPCQPREMMSSDDILEDAPTQVVDARFKAGSKYPPGYFVPLFIVSLEKEARVAAIDKPLKNSYQ